MKIFYLTNIPSPYVVAFLNELGKMADVEATFERGNSSERNQSWTRFRAEFFDYTVLKGLHYSVDKAICFSVISKLKQNKNNRIIISNPITATGIIAITWLKLKHIPYALQVEGGIPKDGKGIVEKVKRFCFSGADHYFSSGKLTDEYLIFYGADKSKITHYPFTSISDDDVLGNPPTIEEKKHLKKELGIEGNFVILSVGQFIYRKGFDILIDAVGKCTGEISTYIIGGTPTEEYIQQCEKLGLKNIHFIDFQPKERILKWMRAANVFVMPTRYDIWGLVVNEAMSQGLPVISSDTCIAGKEMINDWSNGVLFPNENSNDLADILHKIYENKQVLDEMSVNALRTSKEYTYEKMAQAHLIEYKKTIRQKEDQKHG